MTTTRVLSNEVTDYLYNANPKSGGGFYLSGTTELHEYDGSTLSQITNATASDSSSYAAATDLSSGTTLVAMSWDSGAILRRPSNSSTFTETLTIPKGAYYAAVSSFVEDGNDIYAYAAVKTGASALESRTYKSSDDGQNWSLIDTFAPAAQGSSFSSSALHSTGPVALFNFTAWGAYNYTSYFRLWDGTTASTPLSYKDGSRSTFQTSSQNAVVDDKIFSITNSRSGSDYRIIVLRSDAALTSVAPVLTIEDNVAAGRYIYGSGLTKDSSGNLFFISEEGDDSTYEVYKQIVYASFDGGDTWVQWKELPSVSSETNKYASYEARIVIDENDGFYVIRDFGNAAYSAKSVSAWKLSCSND